MQGLVIHLIGLLFYILSVFADVKFTSPSNGDKFSPLDDTVSIDVKWKDTDDSDSATSFDNVESYVLSLCTGSSDDISCFDQIKKGSSLKDKETTVSLEASLLPDGYYYFQMYTKYKGGTTINYSDRFKLSGMGGTTVTMTAVVTVTGDAPQGQTALDEDATTNINSNSFTIPYASQTGKTRFAPMQMQPGSEITVSKWSRRFPTSSVTYFTTMKKSANQLSTITPGWSYTPVSAVNYASTAPMPTYFYAASSRLSKATLSPASKKKRWLE